MAKRKKKHDEGHENAERWLLTYADMITLLMAFFIMMYSMSVMNLEKFREVAFSIRSGFGGLMSNRGPHLLPSEGPAGKTEHHLTSGGRSDNEATTRRERYEETARRMKDDVLTEKLPENVLVFEDARGLVISVVAEPMLFERGSAELTTKGHAVLGTITGRIHTLKNDMQVEGHTCDLPIATAVYPSNWELSSARACSVLRDLQRLGMKEGRLSAVGYGATRPMVTNDSEAHRAKNRRVDIVILNSENQPTAHGEANTQTGAGETPISLRPAIPKVWNVQVHKETSHE